MATNQQIFKELLLHGLKLIRVANGQTKEVQAELMKLGNSLRSRILESAHPDIAKNELDGLIAAMDQDVKQVYQRIADQQKLTLSRLLGVDAKLMQRVADLPVAPTDEALRAAEGRALIQGAAVEQHWRKQAADTSFKAASQTRVGLTSAEDARTVSQRVAGVGRGQRGGIMEQQRRHASNLARDTVQRAAHEGRQAALMANGIEVERWTGILDAVICPDCALRDGKLYTLDGEPVGHNVPLGAGTPLHRQCRCMLIPELHDGGPPPDSGAAEDRGENFLKQLSKKEQEEILGVGRTALYRRGDITMRDLMDQHGRVLTLEELEGLIG